MEEERGLIGKEEGNKQGSHGGWREQWGERGIRIKKGDTKYENATVKPVCCLKESNKTNRDLFSFHLLTFGDVVVSKIT